MERQILTISFRECAATYGLSEHDLREFVELGLLPVADVPDMIQVEPEHLARLVRLHQDLSINKEGIDVILAMRERLLELQEEVIRQRTRAVQLERVLRGMGPVFDADDWI
jgi:chaperone modulatory protein CbpM